MGVWCWKLLETCLLQEICALNVRLTIFFLFLKRKKKRNHKQYDKRVQFSNKLLSHLFLMKWIIQNSAYIEDGLLLECQWGYVLYAARCFHHFCLNIVCDKQVKWWHGAYGQFSIFRISFKFDLKIFIIRQELTQFTVGFAYNISQGLYRDCIMMYK